jgi:hypothetical protein
MPNEKFSEKSAVFYAMVRLSYEVVITKIANGYSAKTKFMPGVIEYGNSEDMVMKAICNSIKVTEKFYGGKLLYNMKEFKK